MADDTKNCPWCGKPPKRTEIAHAYGHKMYYLMCSNDDCPVQPCTPAYSTKGMDKRVWNGRAE